MAREDVQEYYEKICVDYAELLSTLKEMEQEGVPKESVEQISSMVTKLKENYQRVSYIMFLLNKPKRKSKYNKYLKANKSLIKYLKSQNAFDTELAENQQVLNELKNNDFSLK